MRIYVVSGESGEYSDRRNWLVRAFVDEKAAQTRVEEATRRVNELRAQWRGRLDKAPRGANEFDPCMQVSWYLGDDYCVRYSYEIVELEKGGHANGTGERSDTAEPSVRQAEPAAGEGEGDGGGVGASG